MTQPPLKKKRRPAPINAKKAKSKKPAADVDSKLKLIDRIVEAEFVAAATAKEQFPPPTKAEIAFAGRSNVGKSSLLNSLMQRKGLVRTSSTPGCTRQVAWFEAVTGDGAHLNLIDLPGYGYAKRSKSERNQWANLIGDYLLTRSTLKGVVILVDIRRGVQEEELDLLRMLSDDAQVSRNELEVLIVATKMDKLPRAAHKPALTELKESLGRNVIGYSVGDHLGRVPLLRAVRTIAGVQPLSETDHGSEPRA